MATHNILNNASYPFFASAMTIDPLAAANSTLNYNINTIGKWRFGSNNSDSSALVLSQGSSLGTNNTFRMTTAGQRTLPLNPAFCVTRNIVTNITGDGTLATLIWDSKIFDQNNNVNTGTGIFTAPVTGRYYFSVNLFMGGLASSHTSSYVSIVTSNRAYLGCTLNAGSVVRCVLLGTSDTGNEFISALTDMDAGDTCYVNVVVSNGPKSVHVHTVNNTDFRCYFSGELVC